LTEVPGGSWYTEIDSSVVARPLDRAVVDIDGPGGCGIAGVHAP
jgi:hypothetical protein